MDKDGIINGLQTQLKVLYEEKASVHLKFGVSDYDGLCRLIGSLQEQLNDMYDVRKSTEMDRRSSDLQRK